MKKTLQFFPQYAPEPYNLPAHGWNVEKSRFPLSFAPSIPYKGLDDIRFLPGFYNNQSGDFWSYCYLWYLDGNVNFTESQVKTDLLAYYNGLNQTQDATVSVKKVAAASGYDATFECTINTIDKFVTHKPITLNATVNIKRCAEDDKTMVFFEISPQPFTGDTWQKLHAVRNGLSCRKEE
ncbi:MAG TPA: hypothetical protein VG738_05170 [Chitinophagaceae bacterium]|nr:hypothetical protein [Chitinophagaceae bacterium]